VNPRDFTALSPAKVVDSLVIRAGLFLALRLPSLVVQRSTRRHANQRGYLSHDTLSSNSIMLSAMFLIGTLRRGLL